MRPIFLTISLLLLHNSSTSAQTSEPPVSPSHISHPLTSNPLTSLTDEKAIQQVIESESRAYHSNPDRTAYMGYWLLNDQTRLVYTGPEGTFYVTGADMQATLSSGKLPPMDHAVTTYTNFVIRADGNIGWASFDQTSTMPDGEVKYMHEFRCMEKVQGVWKTVQSSIHRYVPK
jgi:hypothetical protein